MTFEEMLQKVLDNYASAKEIRRVDDEASAVVLFKALRDNHTVTTIDLSDNVIGDKGAGSLFEALLYHNITIISISGPVGKSPIRITGISGLAGEFASRIEGVINQSIN